MPVRRAFGASRGGEAQSGTEVMEVTASGTTPAVSSASPSPGTQLWSSPSLTPADSPNPIRTAATPEDRRRMIDEIRKRNEVSDGRQQVIGDLRAQAHIKSAAGDEKSSFTEIRERLNAMRSPTTAAAATPTRDESVASSAQHSAELTPRVQVEAQAVPAGGRARASTALRAQLTSKLHLHKIQSSLSGRSQKALLGRYFHMWQRHSINFAVGKRRALSNFSQPAAPVVQTIASSPSPPPVQPMQQQHVPPLVSGISRISNHSVAVGAGVPGVPSPSPFDQWANTRTPSTKRAASGLGESPLPALQGAGGPARARLPGQVNFSGSKLAEHGVARGTTSYYDPVTRTTTTVTTAGAAHEPHTPANQQTLEAGHEFNQSQQPPIPPSPFLNTSQQVASPQPAQPQPSPRQDDGRVVALEAKLNKLVAINIDQQHVVQALFQQVSSMNEGEGTKLALEEEGKADPPEVWYGRELTKYRNSLSPHVIQQQHHQYMQQQSGPQALPLSPRSPLGHQARFDYSGESSSTFHGEFMRPPVGGSPTHQHAAMKSPGASRSERVSGLRDRVLSADRDSAGGLDDMRRVASEVVSAASQPATPVREAAPAPSHTKADESNNTAALAAIAAKTAAEEELRALQKSAAEERRAAQQQRLLTEQQVEDLERLGRDRERAMYQQLKIRDAITDLFDAERVLRSAEIVSPEESKRLQLERWYMLICQQEPRGRAFIIREQRAHIEGVLSWFVESLQWAATRKLMGEEEAKRHAVRAAALREFTIGRDALFDSTLQEVLRVERNYRRDLQHDEKTTRMGIMEHRLEVLQAAFADNTNAEKERQQKEAQRLRAEEDERTMAMLEMLESRSQSRTPPPAPAPAPSSAPPLPAASAPSSAPSAQREPRATTSTVHHHQYEFNAHPRRGTNTPSVSTVEETSASKSAAFERGGGRSYTQQDGAHLEQWLAPAAGSRSEREPSGAAMQQYTSAQRPPNAVMISDADHHQSHSWGVGHHQQYQQQLQLHPDYHYGSEGVPTAFVVEPEGGRGQHPAMHVSMSPRGNINDEDEAAQN